MRLVIGQGFLRQRRSLPTLTVLVLLAILRIPEASQRSPCVAPLCHRLVILGNSVAAQRIQTGNTHGPLKVGAFFTDRVGEDVELLTDELSVDCSG